MDPVEVIANDVNPALQRTGTSGLRPPVPAAEGNRCISLFMVPQGSSPAESR